MGDELATAPATELAAAIRDRTIGSRELLDVYLERIERLDGPVNAVVTLDVERARAAADAADAATARGRELGPLHGLPVTIQDALEPEGIRSTGGAVELRDHVPVADAPAVARLKRAGAIVFGKTNLPRWSLDLQAYNELFGTTNNPWALDRTTGGSSGGAAAAVACGFTSFEVGTDIGGSVRTPSNFCGVFGLKPSFGVIPQRGYLDQVGGGTTDADINVFGPIARSADDLDLLVQVLAGPEPERELAWRIELPPPRHDDLRGLRIGAWLDDAACPIDTDYGAVLRATVDAAVDAGAKVDEAHPPVDFGEQVGLFLSMVGAAVSPSAEDDNGLTHKQWLALEQQRASVRARWADWFSQYDLLVCPVNPTPAFPHLHEGNFLTRQVTINGEPRPYVDMIAWVGLIGIVGLPSAVVPIGRVPTGLPVGIQVVAPFLRDRDAVAGARAIGELTGGYQTPPGF